MNKSRYLLALLYLYEEAQKDEDLDIEDTLTKAKFSPGEIHYLTEVLEKKGFIEDVGIIREVYRITDKGEKVIKKASDLL